MNNFCFPSILGCMIFHARKLSLPQLHSWRKFFLSPTTNTCQQLTCLGRWCVPGSLAFGQAYLFGTVVCTHQQLTVWDGGAYPAPRHLVKLTCLGRWCVPTNSLPVCDGGMYPAPWHLVKLELTWVLHMTFHLL